MLVIVLLLQFSFRLFRLCNKRKNEEVYFYSPHLAHVFIFAGDFMANLATLLVVLVVVVPPKVKGLRLSLSLTPPPPQLFLYFIFLP